MLQSYYRDVTHGRVCRVRWQPAKEIIKLHFIEERDQPGVMTELRHAPIRDRRVHPQRSPDRYRRSGQVFMTGELFNDLFGAPLIPFRGLLVADLNAKVTPQRTQIHLKLSDARLDYWRRAMELQLTGVTFYRSLSRFPWASFRDPEV